MTAARAGLGAGMGKSFSARAALFATSALFLLSPVEGSRAADNTTYVYDELGRLKTVIHSGGGTVNYTYDAAGNRTRVVSSTTGGANVAPVANPDTASTGLNTAVTIFPLGNDTDSNLDALTITSVTSARATINPGLTSLLYTPASGFTGVDTFSYTISDGHGGAATSTIAVTVSAVNHAPVANPDNVSTNQNTPVVIQPLGNDTDQDADTLSITNVGQPIHGSRTFTGTSITYTPTSAYTGSDTFTYTISDGHGGTATNSVNITVINNNHAPTANPDSYTFTPGTPATIAVLSNDTDPDGDTMLVTSITGPARGYAGLYNGGTAISYNAPTTEGADSLSYTISDGRGGVSSATVSFNIVIPNPPPTANNDAISTAYNTAVAINPVSNDTDNGPISLQSVGQPSHGSTSYSGNIVTYTPTSGYSGADAFNYTIVDSGGLTASATVNVAVQAYVPTIVAENDVLSAFTTFIVDNYYTYGCVSPMGNDTLPPGGASIISVTEPGEPGVFINGTEVCYSNNVYYGGQGQTFSYTIQGAGGGTAVGYITISVHE